MDKLELERVYNEVGTVQKTAKHFGCSYCKIRYQLNKHNIPYKLEYNTCEIDRGELEEVYLATQSVRKVGRHFNTSSEKARYLLNKYGICNKPILYTCNHEFFSKDSQSSFYWAGFFAADGCILDKRSSKMVTLALSKRDVSHIDKFKGAISADNPIKDFLVRNSKRSLKWNDTWKSEIKITSDQLSDDLSRFNVVPRKSKTYTFPEWLIDHALVNHFMRGYFDGDGSFFVPRLAPGRSVSQVFLSLRGTPEFLKTYRDILERECGLKERTNDIRINNGIGVLEYGGNGIVGNIAQYLYRDADIYLDRKRSVILDII